jgi:hypothetical protein
MHAYHALGVVAQQLHALLVAMLTEINHAHIAPPLCLAFDII